MTAVLATVVEGHGEVEAFPVLLRRVAGRWAQDVALHVPKPIRLPRGRLVQAQHLKDAVAVQARKVPLGASGGVLVLADADDDCPVELAHALLSVCQEVAAGRRVRLACAVREYEAWLLTGGR